MCLSDARVKYTHRDVAVLGNDKSGCQISGPSRLLNV